MNDPQPPRRRVLVVEDEMIIALTLEDMLTELGYEIAAITTNLEQSLQAAGSLNFDVAVLDLNLHGQYSLPVAECLRRRGLPFVFQTGYGAQGLDIETFNAPVVSKPFVMEDLDQALAAALEQSSKL